MRFLKFFLVLLCFLSITACTQSRIQNGQITNIIVESENNFSYEYFTQERFEEVKGNQSFALFFHAVWCPSCKVLDNQIKKHVDSFPANTTIFFINYDTEIEARKNYEVVLQSTVVVFDARGNEREKLIFPEIKTLQTALENSTL